MSEKTVQLNQNSSSRQTNYSPRIVKPVAKDASLSKVENVISAKTPAKTKQKYYKRIYSINNKFSSDTLPAKKYSDKEKQVKNLSKKITALGVITLVSTILFFFILPIPVAFVCGILSGKRGRDALELLNNDPDLQTKYMPKIKSGIKLGRSFYVFLFTAVIIAIIIGWFFLGALALISLVYVIPGEWIVFAIYLLVIAAIIFTIIYYIKGLKFILNYNLPEKTNQ